MVCEIAEDLKREFTKNNIIARKVLHYGEVRTYRYENIDLRDPISNIIDETFKISKLSKNSDILISDKFYERLSKDKRNTF